MNKALTFNHSNKTGKKGEQAVMAWLIKNPAISKVVDVSLDPKYQKQDIDFLVYGVNNKVFTVDVKTDTYYSTGNFFLETVKNSNKNSPGCFLSTKADYWFYLFIPQNVLYVLPMKQVRQWVVDHQAQFKTLSHPTKNEYGDILYYSHGVLVNRDFLIANVKGINIYQL